MNENDKFITGSIISACRDNINITKKFRKYM